MHFRCSYLERSLNETDSALASKVDDSSDGCNTGDKMLSSMNLNKRSQCSLRMPLIVSVGEYLNRAISYWWKGNSISCKPNIKTVKTADSKVCLNKVYLSNDEAFFFRWDILRTQITLNWEVFASLCALFRYRTTPTSPYRSSLYLLFTEPVNR